MHCKIAFAGTDVASLILVTFRGGCGEEEEGKGTEKEMEEEDGEQRYKTYSSFVSLFTCLYRTQECLEIKEWPGLGIQLSSEYSFLVFVTE